MTKRMVALLMAVVMCATVFAGCGKKNTASEVVEEIVYVTEEGQDGDTTSTDSSKDDGKISNASKEDGKTSNPQSGNKTPSLAGNSTTSSKPTDTPSTPTTSNVTSSKPTDTPSTPTTSNVTSSKDTEKEEEMEKKEYSILFIGNSYTYYSDMPTAIFKPLAVANGVNVNVTAITVGAYKLSQFADPSNSYGKKVEAALTGSKKYDFVILQEQSVRPAGTSSAEFYTAVRNLCSRIRATGAEPILYSTWGRKAGSSTLTSYGWTNEEMTYKLAAAYQAIGDELDIAVAHAGLAFFDVYTNKTDIELYNSDKSHPSYAGSYLAAATLFAKIFDTEAKAQNYSGTLQKATADTLCTAANNVVFKTPTIPEKYKTSSVGVGE